MAPPSSLWAISRCRSSGVEASSVSEAGDVNGDGYADIILGASGYSYTRGQAYIYHGSSSGLSTPAARTLTGPISTASR